MDLQKTIINLLMSTDRDEMGGMIEYLKGGDFFEAPASTRFHGCHKGGLAEHSLRVYKLLIEMVEGKKIDRVTGVGQIPLTVLPETIIIVGLLHDVCKMGAYIPTPGGKNKYKWNKDQPKGHASLSIDRIQGYIELTEIEIMMIRYHMGFYGLVEFYGPKDWQKGEYDGGNVVEVIRECCGVPENRLRSDHSGDSKKMSKEERQKSKTERYGQSFANAIYHNPIVKLFSFCDEIATLEEKAKMPGV